MEVENHSILQSCFTMWLALLQCVEQLLKEWLALVEYFDQLDVRETNLEYPNCIFISFRVLPRFTKLNIVFQKERPCAHKLYPQICVLLLQLIASFVQFGIQKCDITAVDFNKGNQLTDVIVRRFYGQEHENCIVSYTLDVEVPKNIVILDPTHRSSGDWQNVKALVVMFPNIIPDNKRDKRQEEFISYSLREPV
ncbi:hypothetical protein PR048_001819, partial [Dryococelus australis]